MSGSKRGGGKGKAGDAAPVDEAVAHGRDMIKDWKGALTEAKKTEDMGLILSLTRHPHALVRKTALVELCPCRVERDVAEFWNRVLDMVHDEDAGVRMQVLHTLCDGAPGHLEGRVAEALEAFNRDPDTEVRRKAHKALAAYQRTGKWNIM